MNGLLKFLLSTIIVFSSTTTELIFAAPEESKEKETELKNNVELEPNQESSYYISKITHPELYEYVKANHLQFESLSISLISRLIGNTLHEDMIAGFGIAYLLPDGTTWANSYLLNHPLPTKTDVISVIKACAPYLKSLELRKSDITPDELIEALRKAKHFTSLTLFNCVHFPEDQMHSQKLSTELLLTCPFFKKIAFQHSIKN